jgi:enoyl-CoA hydratase
MSLVTYALADGIATITMDDGKMNALSPIMFAELNAALDRAKEDRAAVVLSGRTGVFSAGFDLRVLRTGGPESVQMVRTGFELAERILAFPAPVVVACTGHAIAMGVFLVLSGDYRVGTAGAFKVGANEVSIGIVMPFFGVEMCRQRLAPAHFHRAVINADIYTPEDARGVAEQLAKLDLHVYSATKLRAREQALKAVRAAIEADNGILT